MRRGSIKRPLAIYGVLFTTGTALAVVTLASFALLEVARSEKNAALTRAAQRHKGEPADDLARAVREEAGGDDLSVGVVSPFIAPWGLSLDEVRAAMDRREPRTSLGVVPAMEPDTFVVYRSRVTLTSRAALAEMQRLLLLSLPVGALFGLVLTSLLARLVLAPLWDLRLLASAAAIRDPLLPTEVSTPNEVSEVAQTFRLTLRQLEQERHELERQKAEILRMQGQLIRASKLASVGRLAAGVAHEIGNPLAAVLGYLNLMRRGLPADQAEDVLTRSVKELNRISEIIKKLLAYARADEPNLGVEPISTGQVVSDALVLLRGHPALRGVTVTSDVEATTEPDALGRSGPLGQVLLNLVINAAQAAKDQPSPRVSVERRYSAGEVEILVADNGPGVPQELTEQIFDPFFTTKPTGEGTGLGLAVSRALVDAMRGDISVTATAGGGATFAVHLPRIQGANEVAPAETANTVASPPRVR